MENKSFKIKSLAVLVCSSAFLFSCRKDLTPENAVNTSNADSQTVVSNRAVADGRTLAANCFQCHGTNGYGFEHLAGEKPSEIIGELNEMKRKNVRSNIMNVHAAAYTTEEIKLIADFFSKQ